MITEVFLGVLWESQGLRVFDYATFEGHGVLFYFGGTFLTLGVFLRSQSRRGFQSSRLRTQLFKILIAHFDQGAFFLISISLSPRSFYRSTSRKRKNPNPNPKPNPNLYQKAHFHSPLLEYLLSNPSINIYISYNKKGIE